MIYGIGLLIIIILIILLKLNYDKFEQSKKVQLETNEMLKQISDIKIENKIKKEEYDRQEEEYQNKIHLLHEQKNRLEEEIDKTRLALENERVKVASEITSIQSEIGTAATNYSDALEEQYIKYEQEYLDKIDKIKQQQSEVQKQLDKMRATQDALIEARQREKELKEKQSFYCLPLTDEDASDIQVLETVKARLNKPRVLSMLIWSTFFQKPMTALCNNVLGTKGTVCGIYKITNLVTEEAYIGQANDIATRWKTHAKCGLDIDRPIGNKLYQSMRDYGIQNFSWELLETCSKEELNEKERYYIDIYDTYNYGFNSTVGNK